jgi:hypothetical protein
LAAASPRSIFDPEDEGLRYCAEKADEILQIIADWYAKAGNPKQILLAHGDREKEM